MPTSSVLVTGATGYVGGRLLDALRGGERRLRALTRSPGALPARDDVEVVRADLRDPDTLPAALAGVDLAYYLVHSLGDPGFADVDRRSAEAFAAAAAAAGVTRIVYLGGIGRENLSEHVASRQEVGRILRAGPVPAVELRASIVIGDGSVSYDAFRWLVDTLPVVALPDWARNPCQPICADDVVAYLLRAGDPGVPAPAVFEIGGADRVPYVAILEEYARQAGKHRAITTVPAPAALAAIAAATKPLQPARARLVTDMIDSLRVDTSVADQRARDVFPVQPLGLVEAISRSL